MNPLVMTLLLVGLWGAFAVSAARKFKALRTGNPTWEPRTDRIGDRLSAVWTFAFWQKKMRYYLLAGIGHKTTFVGFVVLLLRTLVLWGRGYDPTFDLWILGPEPVLGVPLGAIYGFVKDTLALLVITGALVFVYYRVVRRERRMTLSGEGLVILGIIIAMMVADLTYDGASRLLANPNAEFDAHEPGASLAAALLGGLGPGALGVAAQAGFWTHSTLVLIFLNILPYTKHFHIIT